MAKGKKTGGGSRKGIPNKFTKSVKDALQAAFDELQGDPKVNLLDWARKNPNEFYRLAGKLIPQKLDVEAKVTLEKLIEAAAKNATGG